MCRNRAQGPILTVQWADREVLENGPVDGGALTALFGLLGVVLAAVGLHGVMAFAVAPPGPTKLGFEWRWALGHSTKDPA